MLLHENVDRWRGRLAIPLRGIAGVSTSVVGGRRTALFHTSTPSSAARRVPCRRMARALGAGMFLAGTFLAAAPAHAEVTTLLQVFERALEGDSEFLAAGAGNRAAQELRPQARAGLLPSASLGFDVSWNEYRRIQGFETYGIVLSIAQPIYRRDRRIAIEQADSRIAQADALYAAARQDLMVRVSRRYFDVLEAEDELNFALATLEAFEQQLMQSQQRFEVGLTAITDVEEAKAGFDLAKAQRIAAENALDTAREALRETSGEYHEALAPLGEMPLVTPGADGHRQMDGDRTRTEPAPARRRARHEDGPPGDRADPGRALPHPRRGRLAPPGRQELPRHDRELERRPAA